MSNHLSIAHRSALTVLLVIGFYALALFLIGLLAVALYLIARSGGLISFPSLICAVAAVLIIVSILPKRDSFKPPGPELKREENPRLFDLLGRLAEQSSQTPMDEVFLTMEMNAFVRERRVGMFAGRRRVMGIGLPLMQALNVSQFTAVVAHEFGHYHAGDVRFGPWIHGTRAAIQRTIDSLAWGSAYIDAPFRLYGKLFMRVSSAVSRQQELVADRFAAHIAGRNVTGQALERLERFRLSVREYWELLLGPALHFGFHPPVIEGCRMFIEAIEAGESIQPVRLHVTETEPDRYDSHPPTSTRVRELENLPDVEDEDMTCAMELLGDTGKLEMEIFAGLVYPVDPHKFERISWEDYARRAYIDHWSRFLANMDVPNFEVTIAQLPEWLEERYRTLSFDSLNEEFEDPVDGDLACLESGLASTLFGDGWNFHAHPSRLGVYFQKDEECFFEPAGLLIMLIHRAMPPGEWRRACEKAGLAGKRLIFDPIEEAPAGPDLPSPPL